MTKWTKNRVFLRGVRGLGPKRSTLFGFRTLPPKEVLATGLFTLITLHFYVVCDSRKAYRDYFGSVCVCVCGGGGVCVSVCLSVVKMLTLDIIAPSSALA